MSFARASSDPVIEAIVDLDERGRRRFKIAGSGNFKKKNDINSFKPLIASRCMFADTFVYSLGKPAYLLTVPLFNGAGVSVNSSAKHSTHLPFHFHGFHTIQVIQTFLTQRPGLLPVFAKVLASPDVEVNWTAVSAQHVRPVFPGADNRESVTGLTFKHKNSKIN